MAQAGGGYLYVAWPGSIDLHKASSKPKLIDMSADGDSLCSPSYTRDFATPTSKGSTLTSCLRGYPCRRGPANVSTQLRESPPSKTTVDLLWLKWALCSLTSL